MASDDLIIGAPFRGIRMAKHIDADITIRSARPLWGKGALATTEALQAAHPDARVLAIGPPTRRWCRYAYVTMVSLFWRPTETETRLSATPGVRHRAAGDQPPR